MNQSKHLKLEHSLDLLGIEPSHGWDDIEKNYRQLVQKWHPDRNTIDEHDIAKKKFIEINSAYTHIRSHYRQTGSVPRRNSVGSNSVGANSVDGMERPGPLLGIKKQPLIAPTLYKNKFVIAGAITMMITLLFGALLWSLDSRLAENNRSRATAEKLDLQTEFNLFPAEPAPIVENVTEQSSADEAL